MWNLELFVPKQYRSQEQMKVEWASVSGATLYNLNFQY